MIGMQLDHVVRLEDAGTVPNRKNLGSLAPDAIDYAVRPDDHLTDSVIIDLWDDSTKEGVLCNLRLAGQDAPNNGARGTWRIAGDELGNTIKVAHRPFGPNYVNHRCNRDSIC